MEELLETIEKETRKETKRNYAKEILKRHNTNHLLDRFILFSYFNIDSKYKRLVATNKKSWEEDVIKTNEMGISFVEDIDENYLKTIENLFFDSNYTIKFYDIFYYHNIGNKDIDEIKKDYPNIALNTIRDVLLYSDKKELDKVFSYLNDKNKDFQAKFCKIITPIIIELTEEDPIYFKGDFLGFQKYVDYITNKGIHNNRKEKEILDNTYKGMREIYIKDHNKLKTNNPYYIQEFNSYFKDILFHNIDKVKEENLDILNNMKEYSLNNIPLATGNKKEEQIWDIVTHGIDYPGDFATNGSESWQSYEPVGTHTINTIKYKKKKIQKQKEIIKDIFNMSLEKKIDPIQLLKYDESEYVVGLLENLEEKGKVKIYGN